MDHHYHATNAADDLRGMAQELEELCDFLIGLRKRRAALNERTISEMADAEIAVRQMLYPAWEEAVEAIQAASDRDMEQADLTGVEDLKMPQFFWNPEERRCITVEECRELEDKVRRPLRTPTNPATRKAMGES